ncbi:MAG: hypothetical protein AAF682_25020 [Planctomycetota bacterium]
MTLAPPHRPATSPTYGALPLSSALSVEIPLDPGEGGMSIGPAALQPADILVSTTSHNISRIVRGFTGSEVSHAAIYAGNEWVVESLTDGVTATRLADAISDATVAVALRHPTISSDQAGEVVRFAREHVQRQTRFDTWALFKQARFQIGRALCSRLGPLRERCEAGNAAVNIGTESEGFLCSELVVRAFEAARVPLLEGRAEQFTPQSFVEMQLRGDLEYVGHLVA